MTRCADFEEWLRRQEIEIEETLTVEAYEKAVSEVMDIEFTPEQEAVVAHIWDEKYERLLPYGIRTVTYTYATGPRAGQVETRWVVKGYPGLWGYEGMRGIYEEILAGE